MAAAVAVSFGWVFDEVSWLCEVAFATSLLLVLLQVVHASLTREVYPVRLLFGINAVVYAAASLVRDELTTQASAAVVAAVPLLSFFCLVGYRLALAPPRPGEAMRERKEFKDCGRGSRLLVCVVLTVEFVQFNALAFNPDLGAWADISSRLSELWFLVSFIVLPPSEEDIFEKQLLAFVGLACGRDLFALVALHHAPPRAAAAATAESFSRAAKCPTRRVRRAATTTTTTTTSTYTIMATTTTTTTASARSAALTSTRWRHPSCSS